MSAFGTYWLFDLIDGHIHPRALAVNGLREVEFDDLPVVRPEVPEASRAAFQTSTRTVRHRSSRTVLRAAGSGDLAGVELAIFYLAEIDAAAAIIFGLGVGAELIVVLLPAIVLLLAPRRPAPALAEAAP